MKVLAPRPSAKSKNPAERKLALLLGRPGPHRDALLQKYPHWSKVGSVETTRINYLAIMRSCGDRAELRKKFPKVYTWLFAKCREELNKALPGRLPKNCDYCNKKFQALSFQNCCSTLCKKRSRNKTSYLRPNYLRPSPEQVKEMMTLVRQGHNYNEIATKLKQTPKQISSWVSTHVSQMHLQKARAKRRQDLRVQKLQNIRNRIKKNRLYHSGQLPKETKAWIKRHFGVQLLPLKQETKQYRKQQQQKRTHIQKLCTAAKSQRGVRGGFINWLRQNDPKALKVHQTRWQKASSDSRYQKYYSTINEFLLACYKLGITSSVNYRKLKKQDPKLPCDITVFKVFPQFTWGSLKQLPKVPRYKTKSQAYKACKKLGIRSGVGYTQKYKKDPLLPPDPYRYYEGWSWTGVSGGRVQKPVYISLDQMERSLFKLGIRSLSDYNKKFHLDPRLRARPQSAHKDFSFWKYSTRYFPKWTKSDLKRLKALRARGWVLSQLAEEFHKSTSEVHRKLSVHQGQ